MSGAGIAQRLDSRVTTGALAARNDPQQVSDFIATVTGSNRYILDFLSDEVIEQQPETCGISSYRHPSWNC
jgi:hypothetical protein